MPTSKHLHALKTSIFNIVSWYFVSQHESQANWASSTPAPPPGPPPRGGTHVMEICQEERAACGGVEPKVESNALRKGSSTVGNRRGSITMPSHSFSRHADIVWFLNGSVCGNAHTHSQTEILGGRPPGGLGAMGKHVGGGAFSTT